MRKKYALKMLLNRVWAVGGNEGWTHFQRLFLSSKKNLSIFWYIFYANKNTISTKQHFLQLIQTDLWIVVVL